MAEKSTQLSIIIRTVDQATAKIKAINERLDAVTKPTREFKDALKELGEKSGLSGVVEGFKGVGEAVKETLFKFLEIGVVIGETVHLVLELVEHFEDLGKKAERIGVSVDFLAEMRDAAERSGASVESLDAGMQAFTVSLGQARAGTGRMAKFLNLVSPALLKQLKGAKSNEAAFDLLAGAMAKLEDPAKRAALAQKTLGDAALGPLFAKGPKGLAELREHYLKLAGSQKGAAEAAGETHEAMLDLKASTDGVKAALVEGLAPALTVIIKQITEWLQGHREDLKEWAATIGKKLPDAFTAVVGWISKAVDKVTSFVDAVGGLKNVALGAAAIMAGPLIGSILKLSGALLTAISRTAQLAGGMAGIKAPELGGGGGPPGAVAPPGGGGGGTFGSVLRAGALPFAAGIAIQSGLGKLHQALGLDDEGLDDKIRRIQQRHSLVETVRSSALQGIGAAGDAGADAARPDISAHAGLLQAHNDFASQVAAAMAAAMPQIAANNQAKITVDFQNAPRGTRATTDPRSSADVDLSMGYQLGFAP